MRPTPPPAPVLPAAWAEILGTIQQALTQALEAADERERTLDSLLAPPGPAGGPDPVGQQGLQPYDLSLRELHSCVRQAQRDAAEADSALGATEEALQGWLAAAAATRQKLAEAEAHAV